MDRGFIGAGMIGVSDTNGLGEISPGAHIEHDIKPKSGAKVPRNIRFPDQAVQGRSLRWKREHAELQVALGIVVRSQITLINCGPDSCLEIPAKQLGFGRFDIATLRVLCGNRIFSVICAPSRVWKKKRLFNKLLALKAEAAQNGHRVLLIPSHSILNEQRLAKATALASARALKPSRSERQKIIEHVVKRQGSSVENCANLISHHQDPVGVILNLVVHRWLQLSPGPVGPDSLVTAGG
ncbi:hypothetical protein [Devosia sp. LjRoot3]|uniref:hypothetical protein n=1 Tax=Devosia sp. LjRoot3 TaxID=3342319 RepID=UPI003ECE6895